MRARRCCEVVLLLAASVIGCNHVDRLLEGVDPTLGGLFVTLSGGDFEIPQGTEQTVTMTVKRVQGYKGDFSVAVSGQPTGVTASVGLPATVDSLTSSYVITLHVDANVPKGVYPLLTFRAYAKDVTEGKVVRTLNVIDAPSFALSLASSSVALIGGGSAAITVNIARVNLAAGIDLSLDAPTGITATFAAKPATGTSTGATIVVSNSMAPGTYSGTIRGRLSGFPDQTTPLSIVVLPDRIQLIGPTALSIPQDSSVAVPLTVNRNNFSDPVSLSAEGLPVGITASFQPAATTTNGSALTLAIAPTVAPGSYPITVRGRGTDIPDATITLLLTVLRASVAVSVSAQNVSVFPTGPSATSTLAIARTSFTHGVALTIDGAPPGLSTTTDPAVATGNSATITVAATGAIAFGQYTLTVRATPVGFPASASATATLGVTVRAASVAGNVTLDWSACTPPDWVAFQNGTAPWAQAPVIGGVARFTVDSTTGGFAYVQGRQSLSVRYLTRTELATAPFVMCQPRGKVVSGTAVHGRNALEVFTYGLGGAVATSTPAAPDFTLSGVRDGNQDLIMAGGSFPTLDRILIRRDLNLPDGASVGTVDFGSEGVVPAADNLVVQGLIGLDLSQSMYFLTTPACITNPLRTPQSFASGANSSPLHGVPSALMRPTDYHMVTVTTSSGSNVRSASVVFHELSSQSLLLPAPLPAPSIESQPAPYLRLRATIGAIQGIYSDSLSLRYTDGSKTMSVSQSMGFGGNTNAVVSMPDLSGVSGWSNTYAIAAGSTGTWTFAADGSTGGSRCTANWQSVRQTLSGSF